MLTLEAGEVNIKIVAEISLWSRVSESLSVLQLTFHFQSAPEIYEAAYCAALTVCFEPVILGLLRTKQSRVRTRPFDERIIKAPAVGLCVLLPAVVLVGGVAVAAGLAAPVPAVAAAGAGPVVG